MVQLAIAFTPAPASDSRNLRRGSQADPADVYYRAIELAFRTYRRWSHEARLSLVSDTAPPSSWRRQFDSIGVEWLDVAFSSRPPVELAKTFQASLYSLDAIDALAATAASDDEPILLLDPDCLAVKDLTPLVRRATERVCAYPLPFPPDYVANGLTGYEAAELHTRLDPSLTGIPQYFGGEFYGFTRKLIAPVLSRFPQAMQMSIELAAADAPRFSTEEHFLNYALRAVNVDRVDDAVRRIWTAPSHRTIEGDENSLTLWHLPSEKDRGFPTALRWARNPGSWFWSPTSDFEHELGRLVGIGRRPLPRLAYDTVGRGARLAQGRLRRRQARDLSPNGDRQSPTRSDGVD